MKGLKKLALVSAITMTSVGAFAMEAIDDASMAATTGQDGITISVILPDFTPTAVTTTTPYAGGALLTGLQTAGMTNSAGGTITGYKGIAINEVRIHDDDGLGTLGTSATANSGALVIGGGGATDKTEVYTNQASPLVIAIDSVGDGDSVTAGNQAMLNVKITTPTLRIKTGAIYVANSNAAPANFDENGVASAGSAEVNGSGITDKTAAILSGMVMTLGVTTLNVQLGAAEAQGHMIVVNTSMTGGLSIDNMSINDNAGTISGGSIFVGQQKIVDAGGTDLTVVASVDVGSRSTNATLVAAGLQDIVNGMVVGIGQLGTAAGGVDIAMNNVRLGDSNMGDLGDVQILGLNLNGSELVIAGH